MSVLLAFLNGFELVALLALVVILFGAKKLPGLGRGMAQGLKEFKKASSDNEENDKDDDDGDLPSAPPGVSARDSKTSQRPQVVAAVK